MDGVAYLFSIILVGLIILWARRNETVPLDGPTTGLLAMERHQHKVRPDAAPSAPSPGGGTGRRPRA